MVYLLVYRQELQLLRSSVLSSVRLGLSGAPQDEFQGKTVTTCGDHHIPEGRAKHPTTLPVSRLVQLV